MNMRDELIYNTKFLVYDMEMTGLDPDEDEIIEIASLPVDGTKIVDELGFFTQVNTFAQMKPHSRKIHGISNDSYEKSQRPMLDSVLPQFLNQAQGKILVGQRPRMDMEFLNTAGKNYAVMIPRLQIIDISALYLNLFPGASKHNLDEIAMSVGLRRRHGNHNAWDDAYLTAQILTKLIFRLRAKNIIKQKDLLRLGRII